MTKLTLLILWAVKNKSCYDTAGDVVEFMGVLPDSVVRNLAKEYLRMMVKEFDGALRAIPAEGLLGNRMHASRMQKNFQKMFQDYTLYMSPITTIPCRWQQKNNHWEYVRTQKGYEVETFKFGKNKFGNLWITGNGEFMQIYKTPFGDIELMKAQASKHVNDCFYLYPKEE